jgi:adenine phosphoribosyltransferase
MNIEQRIKSAIRDVPNFPKEGIIFKDITPIMQDPTLCSDIINEIKNRVKDLKIDAVAGIESRGFLFGLPLAIALNVPFVMIRKKGKLPYKTVSYKYDLEYGSAEIEMHTDSISNGANVLIHDDLLATGGTALAAAELIKQNGGSVAGFNFLVELSFLEARPILDSKSSAISSLVDY